MIVRLIESCRYIAGKHTFDAKNPEQDVPKKLGDYLVSTGYFEEVSKKQEPKKIESNAEIESKSSKSKALWDESKGK